MPGKRQARRTWLLGAATAVTSGGSAGGHVCCLDPRDRPQSGRPCAFRERKPAHLRLKWASNPFGRRRFASCECCNLSEVRLGEGQLRAGRGTSSRQEWLRSRKGEGEVDAAVAEAGSLEGSALQNTSCALRRPAGAHDGAARPPSL